MEREEVVSRAEELKQAALFALVHLAPDAEEVLGHHPDPQTLDRFAAWEPREDLHEILWRDLGAQETVFPPEMRGAGACGEAFAYWLRRQRLERWGRTEGLEFKDASFWRSLILLSETELDDLGVETGLAMMAAVVHACPDLDRVEFLKPLGTNLARRAIDLSSKVEAHTSVSDQVLDRWLDAYDAAHVYRRRALLFVMGNALISQALLALPESVRHGLALPLHRVSSRVVEKPLWDEGEQESLMAFLTMCRDRVMSTICGEGGAYGL